VPSPRRAPTRQRPLRARLGTRLLRPAPAAGSYATITGRTATKAETASGTSITGDLTGIGVQTGDYVVAQFSMSCTVAQFTGPGGSWVQIVPPTVNSTSEIVAAYAMFNPGSAPVGTSSAAAGRQTCLMQAWSGVDPTTPIDVAAVLTSGTLPLALTGVTTVTPGALLLSGTCADFSTGTWTFPASMTAVINHTSGTGRGAALAQETIASAGPTGTRTWTASTLQACVGYTIALRPAPAGGGGTDYPITQTDNSGLTDTTATAIGQTQTDSAGLTDTSTVQVVKDVTQTDSAGLTDTVAKTISQAQTDTAGLTDATTAALTKTQTDTTGLTDTAAVELSKLLTQTDDTGLTDTAIRTIAQAVTDTAGLTDTTSLSRSATQTDSAGLTDTSTVVSAKSVDQTDSTGLTDAVALRRDLAPTDSTGLTDSTTIGPFSKTQTDSAGLTDSATTVLGSPFTPAYVSVDASTGSSGLDNAATATTTDTGTTGTNFDTASFSGAVDTTTVASGMIDA
jgi:hypothetical protein